MEALEERLPPASLQRVETLESQSARRQIKWQGLAAWPSLGIPISEPSVYGASLMHWCNQQRADGRDWAWDWTSVRRAVTL
ncbi:hypothetical protein CMUS01_07614 [Colletotrichum musicola]|uniref:Uncharacterized protein n=1 Tax=Colletotrichum musicola TaxID=2175873 RepID=A0A8H6KG99_9PEZI|nr:hypothetical protein CMUS01_07614 [Colletotrichum musicola]